MKKYQSSRTAGFEIRVTRKYPYSMLVPLFRAIRFVIQDLHLTYHPYDYIVIGDHDSDEDMCAGSGLVWINPAGDEEFDVFYTIAHELRHMWQFQQGFLKDGYIWKGQKYEVPLSYYYDREVHDSFPWERDADDYARRIRSQLMRYVLKNRI